MAAVELHNQNLHKKQSGRAPCPSIHDSDYDFFFGGGGVGMGVEKETLFLNISISHIASGE